MILLNNIPLPDFLNLVLGPVVERVSVPNNIASLLEAADPHETLLHIEWPSDKTSKPQLWRATEWRTDYANVMYKRELAALQRHVEVLASEMRATLTKKLCAQLGLEPDMVMDMAAKIVRSRLPAAASTFGLDIAELLQAEEAVKAFQQTRK